MVTRYNAGRYESEGLRAEEIEAHRMLTNSMNLLSERIQKTEADFVGHLKKVEDRLDQIVELTKTVAVLQNQTSLQGDNINDLRAAQREHFQKVDQSVSRIHTRIEEVQAHTSSKLELVSKDAELVAKELKTTIETSLKETTTLASNTDKEFKAWLNRGWGAWAIFVFVASVASTGFYKWVDGLDRDRDITTKSLSTVVTQLSKQTDDMKRLSDDIRDARVSQKQLEVTVLDLEKLYYQQRNQKEVRQ